MDELGAGSYLLGHKSWPVSASGVEQTSPSTSDQQCRENCQRRHRRVFDSNLACISQFRLNIVFRYRYCPDIAVGRGLLNCGPTVRKRAAVSALTVLRLLPLCRLSSLLLSAPSAGAVAGARLSFEAHQPHPPLPQPCAADADPARPTIYTTAIHRRPGASVRCPHHSDSSAHHCDCFYYFPHRPPASRDVRSDYRPERTPCA